LGLPLFNPYPKTIVIAMDFPVVKGLTHVVAKFVLLVLANTCPVVPPVATPGPVAPVAPVAP
jgi:hypothetical protein